MGPTETNGDSKLLETESSAARQEYSRSFMAGKSHDFEPLSIVDKEPHLGSIGEGGHPSPKKKGKSVKFKTTIDPNIPVGPQQAPDKTTSAPGSLEKSSVKKFKEKTINRRRNGRVTKTTKFVDEIEPGDNKRRVKSANEKRRRVFEKNNSKFRTLPRDFMNYTVGRFRSRTVDVVGGVSASTPCSPAPLSPVTSPQLAPVPTFLGSPPVTSMRKGPLPDMPELDDFGTPELEGRGLPDMPEISDSEVLQPPSDMPPLDLDPPSGNDDLRE
eukprot:TRINITY_DN3747_c0_g1_i1.p1 TRINITY_DN3747_c0_g1~~TRINITY_DN3747_c0_g1_i1.p1  ORF type:complete len:289 (+),score=69.81 TRINITY_DN3747_c0_g1_i1:57-869(+)